MELKRVMEERRSMRAYDPEKKVEHSLLEELLRTAALAPSWKNFQTARYYVAESPEMIEKVRETCFREFNRKNTAGVQALIVSTFVKSRSGFDQNGNPENEVGEGWGAYDLGIHDAHLVLRAKDLGLDTLIMGIRDGEKLREIFGIPDSQEVVSVIAVGYGAASPQMPPRKSPEETAVFF